jgi:hypothetical protein
LGALKPRVLSATDKAAAEASLSQSLRDNAAINPSQPLSYLRSVGVTNAGYFCHPNCDTYVAAQMRLL